MSLDLRLDVRTTRAGVYAVTFAYLSAPLGVQKAAFAVHNLQLVSPAKLGFLRATQKEGDTTFNSYIRTNADVFYDDRNDGQVVIVPNEAISRFVGIAHLVAAHRAGKEYIIPETQTQRDLVYAMIDGMLKNGTAVAVQHGTTQVATSEFGATDLTAKLFSDARLGIQAQEYGDLLQSQGQRVQSFEFDDQAYASVQNGPYINRLRLCGPVSGFNVRGYGRHLDDLYGAFGVRFEKIAEGEK